MAEFDTDYNYDGDIDNTDLAPFAGTCGTLIFPSLARWDEGTCIMETERVREQGRDMRVGVVVTAVSQATPEQEEIMTKAGWVKTLTYKGQYQQFDYETNQSRSYKMTHWALVLKPWEEK